MEFEQLEALLSSKLEHSYLGMVTKKLSYSPQNTTAVLSLPTAGTQRPLAVEFALPVS